MIAVLGTLVGVALGFFLQFLYQKRRDEALLKKKRAAIESELGTNAALIPQKRKLLVDIQSNLCKGELLRGSSVHFPAYCYLGYIGEVSVSLTSRQRENLVVIYETLRIIDEYMDHLHSEYMEMKRSGVVPNFRRSYIGEIGDLVYECSLTEMLIEKYLAGKPQKIAWDKLPQVSRKNDGKLKCPFCWRDTKKEVFIVKQTVDVQVGTLCPVCGGGVIDVGGKLYVERSGERLPLCEPPAR